MFFIRLLCRALGRLFGLTFPGLGKGYSALYPHHCLVSILPSVWGPGTSVCKEPSEKNYFITMCKHLNLHITFEGERRDSNKD